MVLKDSFTTNHKIMEKQKIDREQEVVFTNWTDDEFVGVWNKKQWRMRGGRSFYLPFYLAEHFAKGLVDREILKKIQEEYDKELKEKGARLDYNGQRALREEVETRYLRNANLRQELFDKCVDVPKEGEISVDVVIPKEVPQEERVLHRDENVEKLKEKFPGIDKEVDLRVNPKAETTKDAEGFDV